MRLDRPGQLLPPVVIAGCRCTTALPQGCRAHLHGGSLPREQGQKLQGQGLQVTYHHFCLILLLRVSHKAIPDQGTGNQIIPFDESCCNLYVLSIILSSEKCFYTNMHEIVYFQGIHRPLQSMLRVFILTIGLFKQGN
ncbi:unnamed protein product [Rangifer tarandus platyrhynchus]|uniref:Uncharacterized protein n=2 Tax=Rangifer tarandus platyrhynchus TaxID=3082113 RepID=A0AC59YKW4_RANTA|nr:unnamed protein product [Rangifer tarandus platyrhynchus]